MNGSAPLPVPPLGRKVEKPPEPKQEEWLPVAGKPHLQRNAKGDLRTVPSPITPQPMDYMKPIKG